MKNIIVPSKSSKYEIISYLRLTLIIWVTFSFINPSFAQEKSIKYYSTHEQELLPDAEEAFSGGFYERAIELCDWYYILVGDKKANNLREKSSMCALLLRDIEDLASLGKIDEAEQKVKALRSLNPNADVDISIYTSKLRPNRIEMEKKYLFLPLNEIETIQIQAFPKGTIPRESIKWQSSNPEIVSVDSYGTISALQKGEATITAFFEELSTACVVSVDNLKLSSNSIQFYVGDKSKISLSSPVDNVVWRVENPEIVSLQELNDGVEVYAKHAGNTLVTALLGRNKLVCEIEIEDTLIDMGMPSGTMWASRNLGANFKTDCGDSFSTDEVFLSNSNIAEVRLGKNWAIPTREDYQELVDNCKMVYTQLHNQSGVLFTSRINGNTLFFPTKLYNYGAYHVDAINSVFLIFMSEFCGLDTDGWKNKGSLVRAVYRPNIESLNIVDLRLNATSESVDVDDLSTNLAWASCNDAKDIKYLYPQLRILSSQNINVQFDVKIIDPDGNLVSGDVSHDGFSYSCKKSIEKGYSEFMLDGWGNNEGGTYMPGGYRIELWHQNKCFYSNSFTLYEVAKGYEGACPAVMADTKPSFNGVEGIDEFYKWVNSRIIYPEIAKENGIQGRVQASFIVTADGSVRRVRITRSVDTSLDNEILRVVSSSPNWTPGSYRGRVVDVEIPCFFSFVLR